MISHLIGRRCYSTSKKVSKLWVKLNKCPSTKVSIKNCINIDDFADKVKQKLNIKSQVALFTSLEKEYIMPGLTIKELLKTEFKNNSDETPVFIKIMPVVKDLTTPKKTIYIGETNRKGLFNGTYKKWTLRNDQDMTNVIENAKGLIHPSFPEHVFIHFDEIQDGEKYQFYNFP
ncbi:hypothetical protein BC833DRAFT_595347 [Globomyces pollinis-pini]|nr:hypothetical protein BC833DRAFT_595347 [Globomyces pollinis-pini]